MSIVSSRVVYLCYMIWNYEQFGENEGDLSGNDTGNIVTPESKGFVVARQLK